MMLRSGGDPFKATQLWKEAILSFRAGMPCRRRRIKMHFYDNCFSGAEAIHWLHNHLQETGMFGAVISRQQVEKLLQKFLTSGVIEEVRGRLRDFKEDSCYLYHFVTQPGPFNFINDENATPQRTKGKGRSMSVTPASSLGKRKRRDRNETSLDYDGTLFANEYASTSCDEESFSGGGGCGVASSEELRVSADDMVLGSPVKRCRESGSESGVSSLTAAVVSHSGQSRLNEEPLPALVARVWKELTLNRLLLLIELPSLDGVLTQDAVDGRNIAHNVSSVARLVGGVCLSAAQSCLAAMSGSGSAPGSSHHPPPPPLAPAANVTRRRSSNSVKSIRAPKSVKSISTRFHGDHGHLRSFIHNVAASMSSEPEGNGDFPQWVILSMHCLSKWPDSCTEEFVGGMPIYGGYELDVFQSLVHFLHSEPEPLIGTGLYDLYMAVLKLVGANHAHSVEAMQLCFLLLPQRNRLRLHRILHFISKASANRQLRLSKNHPNQSILLEHFAPVVLRKSSKINNIETKDDRCTLVTFMVQHYQSILKVPDDLKVEVQERIRQLQEGKGSPVEVKHVFCRQVTKAQYEEQGKCHSHQHMSLLLEGILADTKMSDKEKKKKLKMFQQEYPEIYSEVLRNKLDAFPKFADDRTSKTKARSSKLHVLTPGKKLAAMSGKQARM